MWALNGLHFLQGISICSSPVLSRHHSVDIFFSAWSTFSSFFFLLHFPASWCFFLLFSMFSRRCHQHHSDARCGLCVGPLWSCLAEFVWDRAAPDLFPQRPPCSPPAANTMPHKLMGKQTTAKHNPRADLTGTNINNLKIVFMLGKRFRGVTDLLTCER